MDRLFLSFIATEFVYKNIDSFAIFEKDRANLKEKKHSYLYGEVPLQTWKAIVDCANPKKDGVFFDLGSGAGKVALQSYLLFDFRKSIGVELFLGLHEAALEAKNIFEKSSNLKLENHLKNRELIFINDDIFNADLREADFIFLNYPLLSEPSYLGLEAKLLSELKAGTKIVATIRALKNPAFKLFAEKSFRFSWGRARAYFYET